MKLFLFFLLLIPVATAELTNIDVPLQNKYPGESFNVSLVNNILPSLLTISINQPCITQRTLLMKKSPHNLTIKINESSPIGQYTCQISISYNSTITTSTTTIPSGSGSSGSSKSSTTTIRQNTTNNTGFPWWYYQNYREYQETTTSILNETKQTTSTETTTTSILSFQDKIKFKEYGRFYIVGIILLIALIAVIIVLKNKPKDPFKESPPSYEPKI